MKVYLLSWIYASPDLDRQTDVNREFYLQFLEFPDLDNWFQDALVTTEHKAGFVAAFRSNILSRTIGDGMHAALLNIFRTVCELPELRECVELGGCSMHQPVFWVMKALQRILCMNAGSLCEAQMLPIGISNMVYVRAICSCRCLN